MIVGLFSILTGKRCPDGRNHSDAEAQPVFNRTGEWDSVFLGYSVRGPSQPANQRDLARSRHSNSAACSVYPVRSRSSLPHVSRSFIAAGRLPLVSADRRQWTTSGLSPAGHITSQVQRRRQQLRLALEQSECPECWRWLRGANDQVSGGPLRFYVGGRTGVDQLVGNGTAGFAELRRDVREPSRQTTSRQNRSAWQAILSCCCLYY